MGLTARSVLLLIVITARAHVHVFCPRPIKEPFEAPLQFPQSRVFPGLITQNEELARMTSPLPRRLLPPSCMTLQRGKWSGSSTRQRGTTLQGSMPEDGLCQTCPTDSVCLRCMEARQTMQRSNATVAPDPDGRPENTGAVASKKSETACQWFSGRPSGSPTTASS